MAEAVLAALVLGACVADVDEDVGGLAGPLTATPEEALPAIGLQAHSLTPEQLSTLPPNHVTLLRVGFTFWLNVTTTPDGRVYDGYYDNLVREHVSRGIHVLPVIGGATDTPAGGAVRFIARDELDEWERFAGSLAERYGPDGTFWADNPDLPYLPVRAWEIWNEPNLQTFWDDVEMSRPRPRHYRRILRRAFIGLRLVDPRARVVLGGLSFPRDAERSVPWYELLTGVLDGGSDARQARNRCLADAVAIHPYSATVPEVMEKVRKVYELLERRRMTGRDRDRRDVQIWITELGWAVPVPGEWPATGNNTVESEEQQRERVVRVIDELSEHRRRWRLGPLHWYAFSDLPGFHMEGDGDGKWPDYAGLWTLWGKDAAGNETIPGRPRDAWFALGERAAEQPPFRLPPVRCTLGDVAPRRERSLALLRADDAADDAEERGTDAIHWGDCETPACIDDDGLGVCPGALGSLRCTEGAQLCTCDEDGTFSDCGACTTF